LIAIICNQFTKEVVTDFKKGLLVYVT